MIITLRPFVAIFLCVGDLLIPATNIPIILVNNYSLVREILNV